MLGLPKSMSWTLVFLLVSLAGSPAGAAEIEILSNIPARLAPDTANGASRPAALSKDGRFFLFESDAQNLVDGVNDHNQSIDVFLFDRVTGETMLVSQSSGPDSTTGNDDSWAPSMSADGRFVAFTSTASDLIPGQAGTGGLENVYLWDRINRTTELVSHESGSRVGNPDGPSSAPRVSADGRFVTYQSEATDLVDGVVDRNFSPDVFVYNRRTSENVLVSRSASSPGETAISDSIDPTISADGRFIAFRSGSTNLMPGQIDSDAIDHWDFFLWDRTTGRNVLVSHAAGNPLRTGNGQSLGRPLLSANGELVAFTSTSRNLVARQSGTGQNLFVWQRATGVITLVTHAQSSPTQGAGDFSFAAGISADGSQVLYNSTGRRLVPGQKDHPSQPTSDAFLWSRQSNQSRLLSGKGGSASRTGNGSSAAGDLSSDASWAILQSDATDLVPGVADANGTSDVFLWSRGTGRLTLLSHAAGASSTPARGNSGAPLISTDGRFFTYLSYATNLVAGVRDTISSADLVLESQAGDREIVTLHAPSLASATPQGSSTPISVSADGRWVVFLSTAVEFLPRLADRNGDYDVFLKDRVTGTTTLVSHVAGNPQRTGNGRCVLPKISADGRFVAMACNSTDLVEGGVPAPGAPLDQLYVWSRETGAITLVSRAAGTVSRSITGFVSEIVISADGSVVSFVSTSTDLVAGQADAADTPDVFTWERATGTVSLLSGAGGSPTVAAAGLSSNVWTDSSGRLAVFHSDAPDLGTSLVDANSQPDVFLRDRAAGTTVLVSRTADGAEAAGGVTPRISADGRFVAFASWSGRIVPGQVEPDPEISSDLFLWDRQTGVSRLVSHSAEGPQFATGGIDGFHVDLDSAGRFVAFASTSTRLVPPGSDENQLPDVFLFDRESGVTVLVSRAQGTANVAADGYSLNPLISADGRLLVFQSNAADLTALESEGRTQGQVYLYDRSTDTTSLVSHSFLSPLRRTYWPVSLNGLAASGSLVLLSSQTPDLAPLDFNGLPDAFAVPLP
jgi:Tol biopolymer transport system component